MAHFAKIENGTVTNVVVIDDQHEGYGEQYLNDLGLDGTWIQTSYNANIRKKFAGIGDEYLEEYDAFRSPEPENAIEFDYENWTWIVPEPEVDNVES
jgi:hypothetical protein